MSDENCGYSYQKCDEHNLQVWRKIRDRLLEEESVKMLEKYLKPFHKSESDWKGLEKIICDPVYAKAICNCISKMEVSGPMKHSWQDFCIACINVGTLERRIYDNIMSQRRAA